MNTMERGRLRCAGGVLVALAVVVCALALTACGPGNDYLARRDTIWLGAGEAVAHNRAVHTIDPWPVYAKDTNLSADGKRMLVGVKRYQENKSLEPGDAETNEDYKKEEPSQPPPPAQPPAAAQ